MIYVICIEAAKGGGPRIGAPRRDIGVSTPDRSYESERTAEREAARQYAAERGIPVDRVYVIGTY